MKKLNLPRALYDEMLRRLQDAYPLEACGIMAGTGKDISRHYAVNNKLRSPVAYEMDPQQQLQAILDLEDNGLQMLAIYHSHPQGPQTPSASDVSQATYPHTAHIIVSLSDRRQPVARAFLIRNGHFHEIGLNVV